MILRFDLADAVSEDKPQRQFFEIVNTGDIPASIEIVTTEKTLHTSGYVGNSDYSYQVNPVESVLESNQKKTVTVTFKVLEFVCFNGREVKNKHLKPISLLN